MQRRRLLRLLRPASKLASTVMRGHGSASGDVVTDAYVFVCGFRDGLIAEGWGYRTAREALEAAGLEQ